MQKGQSDAWASSRERAACRILSSFPSSRSRGISTLRSYRSSQIFEALGIHSDVIDKYFAGTYTRVGGIGLSEITEEIMVPHRRAYTEPSKKDLFTEGIYAYRKYGEHHAWNPETISLLQWSTSTGDYSKFKEFSSRVNSLPSMVDGSLDFNSSLDIPAFNGYFS